MMSESVTKKLQSAQPEVLTVLVLGMVIFQIGLCTLTSGSNGMCVIFIGDAGRRELEEVRSSFLNGKSVRLFTNVWVCRDLHLFR
jgi:hypothetical protein